MTRVWGMVLIDRVSKVCRIDAVNHNADTFHRWALSSRLGSCLPTTVPTKRKGGTSCLPRPTGQGGTLLNPETPPDKDSVLSEGSLTFTGVFLLIVFQFRLYSGFLMGTSSLWLGACINNPSHDTYTNDKTYYGAKTLTFAGRAP